MGVEESVYLAKLAEQAERYEGWSGLLLSKVQHLIKPQKWWRT